MTHICLCKLIIVVSDNDLSPGRHQAIISTNAGILFILNLGTNFSEILSEVHTFSFNKMYLKIPSAKWRPFCLGLNEFKCSKYYAKGVNKGFNLNLILKCYFVTL